MKTYIYTLSKLLSIFQTRVKGLENLCCGTRRKPRCDCQDQGLFNQSSRPNSGGIKEM